MWPETASAKFGLNALDYDRGTFYLAILLREATSLLAGYYAFRFS